MVKVAVAFAMLAVASGAASAQPTERDLAHSYCVAAQQTERRKPVDIGALAECMKALGHNGFRFNDGARF
jgi:hypothetical protein